MAAVSYYDLIDIVPKDTRPMTERVHSALQKALPIAAKAGIAAAIGCSVAALFACGTSAEVMLFMSSIGINIFTGDLIGRANKDKRPSPDEIDELIRRIQASGSAEISEFSAALGIVTTTLEVIDDRTLKILTSVNEQRVQAHLLGEDIVGILFKQRAHYDNRFDNLEALLPRGA